MQELPQTVPKLNNYCRNIKHTTSDTMKSMEVEADLNNDNEITADELRSFIHTNVIDNH